MVITFLPKVDLSELLIFCFRQCTDVSGKFSALSYFSEFNPKFTGEMVA